jgi:hypothetical protein
MNHDRKEIVEWFLRQMPPAHSGFGAEVKASRSECGGHLSLRWSYWCGGIRTSGHTTLATEAASSTWSGDIPMSFSWHPENSLWEHQAAEFDEATAEAIQGFIGSY